MRVGHVISGLSFKSGGTTRAVLDMVRWQTLLGGKCTIITGKAIDSDISLDFVSNAGAKIVEFPVVGPLTLRFTPGLAQYFRKNVQSFDLLVLHSSYQFPALVAASYCRRAHIPYIFTPHGSLDPAVREAHHLRNRIVDFVYHDRIIRNANAWHFTSRGESTRCERQLWRSAFIEPLGVDLEEAHSATVKGSFRRAYRVPEDAILFLFLSRVTRKKGIDILVDAFLRAGLKNPKIYLALCGPIDPDMASLIKSFSLVPEVCSRVIITGLIGGRDKYGAFADADCFVMPTYSENFGISVFEALAHGLPVITTTGMDLHAELSESGRVKIISPSTDSLLDAFSDFSVGRWKPTSTAEDVRKWLSDNFSWRTRAQNLLNHYSNVVDAAHRERSKL